MLKVRWNKEEGFETIHEFEAISQDQVLQRITTISTIETRTLNAEELLKQLSLFIKTQE